MPLNDSSTGGFIAPYAPPTPPPDDDAFDAIMQNMVSGITGIQGTLVRPRWQPIPPQMPEPTVDWCAIGVIDQTPEYGCTVRHWPGEPTNVGDRTGQGFDEYIGFVKLQILASFYGPNANANADMLRDGFAIDQNRETLFLNNMQLVWNDCKFTRTPELVNGTIWYRRVDLQFFIVRMIDRSYPVLNLLEAVGTITADPHNSEPFHAGPGAPDRPA